MRGRDFIRSVSHTLLLIGGYFVCRVAAPSNALYPHGVRALQVTMPKYKSFRSPHEHLPTTIVLYFDERTYQLTSSLYTVQVSMYHRKQM